MSKVKLVSFNATNAKRLDAVSISFDENGTTVIGGSNGQGKTSVLDLIMAAVLGKKYIPSNPIKDGHEQGDVKVELNNGVIIRRSFKNGRSTIKVEGCSGSNQQFLNDLFGENALDVREFMNAKDKKKGEILMKLCGLDFTCIDADYTRLYQDRTNLNREELRLKQVVDSLPRYDDVPEEEVNTVKVISEITELGNTASKLLRDIASYEDESKRHAEEVNSRIDQIKTLKDTIGQLEEQIDSSNKIVASADQSKSVAEKELEDLNHDEKIETMKAEIAGAEEINAKVRANREHDVQSEALLASGAACLAADQNVKSNRVEKLRMLSEAKMPVKGLSVDEGLITFNGKQWDSLSTAEQFMIGTAIQAAQNPDAPIILLDHMEAFDEENLRKYSEWCARKEFQVIGTRVSTGSECTVIIEDGNVKEQS